jgi:flavin-dependent dehydrogenase
MSNPHRPNSSVPNSAPVIIIGGGPAGAAAAITLSRRGSRPIVLESRSGPELKVGECLPPTANPLLDRLGLTEHLRQAGHLISHGNRSAWGSSTPTENNFLFSPYGSGWHLDRRAFESTLAERAREEGADWRYGWRLKRCTRRGGTWLLQANTPDGDMHLEAGFLVDATGRAARLARQLGERQIRYDRLVGAATLMEPRASGTSRDSFTLVEAVASGWWYSSQLPSGDLMAAYFTDSDLLDHRAVRKIESWLARLAETDHTWNRVRQGDHRPRGEPVILPANTARLSQIAGADWLAAGDAAVAYDPLSSYGISSALGAGLGAGNAIADQLAGDADAIPNYIRTIDRAFEQYLALCRDHYAIEQRWPDEPFWRRRRAT